MRPGVRAIMKVPFDAVGFIPESARIVPIAPYTLMVFLCRERLFDGARCFHMHTINTRFA